MEDTSPSEVVRIIEEIDRTNRATELALTPNGDFKRWDYRKYNISSDNKTRKERIYYAMVAYEELTDR